MTKQQFLDKLIYESDRIIYDGRGNIIEVGVGVLAYLNKQANDNYQQQHGVRIPSWDKYFSMRSDARRKRKTASIFLTMLFIMAMRRKMFIVYPRRQ